jgi:hypothetical protein
VNIRDIQFYEKTKIFETVIPMLIIELENNPLIQQSKIPPFILTLVRDNITGVGYSLINYLTNHPKPKNL